MTYGGVISLTCKQVKTTNYISVKRRVVTEKGAFSDVTI